ncbi:MAG: glutamate racemase, partial [Flavobacteriales bacterium]
VGVIGTKGTIRSDIYAKKLHARSKKLEVASLATPLLAPMIEEGFFDNRISRTVIASYLDSRKLAKIDALILACTHYPLIKKEVDEYYRSSVEIVDSAGVVAGHVKDLLKRSKSMAPKRRPTHRFFVSDFTRSFEESTKYFFKKGIHLEKKDLWM